MTEKELNLARDLLPLYVEGKVSEDSARFVQSCMEKNEELREMYADMCREIEMPVKMFTESESSDSHMTQKRKIRRILRWGMPAERFIMAEGMPLYMNPSMARKRRNRRILRWVLPFVLLLLGYGGLLWGIIVYLFHMLSWGVL